MASIRDADALPDDMDFYAYHEQLTTTLKEIAVEVVRERRRRPADDLATVLAHHTDANGEHLSDDAIGEYARLSSVAGNDTTKQTRTHAFRALFLNPEHRAWLWDDFDARIVASIEEFVRYTTPIMNFSRTVLDDVELRGQHLQRGDKVVTLFNSGNRDEDVWPDPWAFDLARERQPQLAFGGGGVHYCLGNGIAKAQLRALYSEVLTHIPDYEVLGEPDYLQSDTFNGIKHLRVRV